MTGTESTVTREARGRVLLMGLNRPAKRNALNLQMLRELAEAHTAFERVEGLWCAVFFAHGEHFTAGFEGRQQNPRAAGEHL